MKNNNNNKKKNRSNRKKALSTVTMKNGQISRGFFLLLLLVQLVAHDSILDLFLYEKHHQNPTENLDSFFFILRPFYCIQFIFPGGISECSWMAILNENRFVICIYTSWCIMRNQGHNGILTSHIYKPIKCATRKNRINFTKSSMNFSSIETRNRTQNLQWKKKATQ